MKQSALAALICSEQKAQIKEQKEDALIDYIKNNWQTFVTERRLLYDALKYLEQPISANDILSYVGLSYVRMEKASKTDVLSAAYCMVGSKLFERFISYDKRQISTVFFIVGKEGLVVTYNRPDTKFIQTIDNQIFWLPTKLYKEKLQ